MRGPRLFNCLPRVIRNSTKISVDDFKIKLDQFLAKLPDQPKIGDLVPNVFDQLSMKPSNSIIMIINHMKHNYGESELPLLYIDPKKIVVTKL